jgi:hypothetical protein
LKLTLEIVEALQGVVATAHDERPIQQFIEAHPETLAALLGGRDRSVRRTRMRPSSCFAGSRPEWTS